jgi:acetylglutamate kinase
MAVGAPAVTRLVQDAYATLRVAARYVAQFQGALFVLKVTGRLAEEAAHRAALAEQVEMLHAFGVRMCIVHGAGSQIDRACTNAGVPVEKTGGRRITTPGVLAFVEQSYRAINRLWVETLAAQGLKAVSCPGEEGLLEATPRPPSEWDGRMVHWGLVGDLRKVDPGPLEAAFAAGAVPVVSPLARDPFGGTLNCNADTVAAFLAVNCRASKLVFLLSVPGLLQDPADPSTLIRYGDLADLTRLEREQVLRDGMRVKARAIESALSGGVSSVHLVSGLDGEALVREVLSHEGSGSMFVAQKPETPP